MSAAPETTQDEVRWLLEIVKSEYPADFPERLLRIDRDETLQLETGERSVSFDGDQFMAVQAGLGSKQREVYDQDARYRVETTVDMRVEGKAAVQGGQIRDKGHFTVILKRVQAAVNSEIEHPTVDPDASDIGRINYHDLRIIDEKPVLSGDKNYYRTDFTVLLQGIKTTP